MSLSEAARTSRASRENINSRERSKETKEKENERTRQTQPTPATTPRPARARSADMRKDNNNATHKSSPEGAPSQPSHAKRPNRDAGRHPSSAARETKTPVKATAAEAPKSAKGVKTEEGAATTGKANNKSVAAAATKKADEEAVKAAELVQVTVPPADSQPESKEVVNVKVEESHDPTAVETLPAAGCETEMISMTDSTASGDAPDVEVLPPVTTATNNDVAVVSTPSEVSNAEGQVSVDSIPSGATTPSETGSVSGDSVPSSLTSRKIISSEEEAKAALAEKRRLAREQMEREAERERLRAEEERLLEEERQRQEELEQKLAEEEMDRMALEARQAEEERLQKYVFLNVLITSCCYQ